MKKLFACLAAICLFAGGTFADPVGSSPLKIFSGGIGGGAMYPLNDELKEQSGDVFGKISLIGSWMFTERVSFYGDLNWFPSGRNMGNFGADFGADFYLSASRVKPFIGAGLGAHYFDRETLEDDLGVKFGASLTAHAGLAFELSETVEIRVRVPYHVVLNHTTDMGVGFDVGVMFFNSLRKIRRHNH